MDEIIISHGAEYTRLMVRTGRTDSAAHEALMKMRTQSLSNMEYLARIKACIELLKLELKGVKRFPDVMGPLKYEDLYFPLNILVKKVIIVSNKIPPNARQMYDEVFTKVTKPPKSGLTEDEIRECLRTIKEVGLLIDPIVRNQLVYSGYEYSTESILTVVNLKKLKDEDEVSGPSKRQRRN